jgi:hypothetical protein
MAGGLAGGPMGALLAGVATNPAIAVRALGMMERITQSSSEGMAAAIRQFLRRTGAAARPVAREGARRARRAGVAGAEAYMGRIRQLDEDRRDPRGMVARMGSRLSDLDAAPHVRDAVAAGIARRNAYLQQHRPPSMVLPGQIRPQTRALPSPATIAAFMRRVRAADNPSTLIDDLRSGTISAEAVDAVRNVYPRIYRQMQETVLREMASDEARPGFAERVRLGVLLGAPTDPALTPGHLAVTQGVFAARNEPMNATPRPAAPRSTANVASGMEALERRG